MNPIQQVVKGVDAVQRRTPPLAFLWAVQKKFGDDQAGSLAALIAYYGFVSIFPLLLVLITILGLVATPELSHRIVNSAVGEFPIVGKQLTGPNGIKALREGSVVGLIIGLIGLIWGSQGIAQAAQNAMARVWNVPKVDRPGFLPRLARSGALLTVLALNVLLTTALAGIATFGGGPAWYTRAGSGLLTLALNIGLYILGFRILTPGVVETRELVPGGVIAGTAWSILQYVGALLVGHQLRHSSEIYGYFASVLGLLAFLYIAAQITLYAAEANVVRARKLFPRSLAPPPLTDADKEVLAALVKAQQSRPEQQVAVGFDSETPQPLAETPGHVA